jgi:adenylate cyclase
MVHDPINSALGANVLSALAEAAGITYSGSEAPSRVIIRQDTLKFAEAALADSKRKGLLLAVRARWVALAVTAVTIPIVNPHWDVVYYVVMIIPFAVIGWAQLKVGKAGRSGPELLLMFCDLALLTFLAIVPNPFTGSWPPGMQFRFNTFSYFFVFLATATLAYSWRTVVAMGFWTAGLWAAGVAWIYLQPETHAALSERVRAAVGADQRMFDVINPSAIGIGARFQEIIVFLIVALTLALAVPNNCPGMTNRSSRFEPRMSQCCSPTSSTLPPMRTAAVRWRSLRRCDCSTSAWKEKSSSTTARWTNISATD